MIARANPDAGTIAGELSWPEVIGKRVVVTSLAGVPPEFVSRVPEWFGVFSPVDAEKWRTVIGPTASMLDQIRDEMQAGVPQTHGRHRRE